MPNVPSRDAYANTYRRLSEDELDRLLTEFSELEEDAKLALVSEAKTRRRTDADVSAVIAAAEDRKRPLTSIEGADDVLTQFVGRVRDHRGTGRVFYGRSNVLHSDRYNYDEFDATLWWTISWLPFVPRGSFRIRTRVANPEVPRFARRLPEFVIVKRLPFLWAKNIAWLALAGLVWVPVVALIVAIVLGHQ